MKIVGFAVFTIHEYTLHILIYTLILILQTPDWFPKLALPLSVLQTALPIVLRRPLLLIIQSEEICYYKTRIVQKTCQ